MMTEDPRRAIVEVIARLGRETQLHIDERLRHFRITDGIIIFASVLLVILAVFNVYYVRVLYKDLDTTVSTMESLHNHLIHVNEDMGFITQHMAAFDTHMVHMDPINGHMSSLSDTLSGVRGNMRAIAGEIATIEESMGLVGQGMGIIDQRVHLMNGGVAVMRENVRQIARPMGSMMPFMP
jgi:hypothetical protein